MLQKLKELSPSSKIFTILVKGKTGYSRSYAYQLIRYFEICEELPVMKYISIPIKLLIGSYEDLIPYIKEDKIFWKGTDIKTPTISNAS